MLRSVPVLAEVLEPGAGMGIQSFMIPARSHGQLDYGTFGAFLVRLHSSYLRVASVRHAPRFQPCISHQVMPIWFAVEQTSLAQIGSSHSNPLSPPHLFFFAHAVGHRSRGGAWAPPTAAGCCATPARTAFRCRWATRCPRAPAPVPAAAQRAPALPATPPRQPSRPRRAARAATSTCGPSGRWTRSCAARAPARRSPPSAWPRPSLTASLPLPAARSRFPPSAPGASSRPS